MTKPEQHTDYIANSSESANLMPMPGSIVVENPGGLRCMNPTGLGITSHHMPQELVIEDCESIHLKQGTLGLIHETII